MQWGRTHVDLTGFLGSNSSAPFIIPLWIKYSPFVIIVPLASFHISKWFISLCVNTDTVSKNINITVWKAAPAPWWFRQVCLFSLTNQFIPVGMCKTVDWGGVILGQTIDKTSSRGQSISHLCSSCDRAPSGEPRRRKIKEETKHKTEGNTPFPASTGQR